MVTFWQGFHPEDKKAYMRLMHEKAVNLEVSMGVQMDLIILSGLIHSAPSNRAALCSVCGLFPFSTHNPGCNHAHPTRYLNPVSRAPCHGASANCPARCSRPIRSSSPPPLHTHPHTPHTVPIRSVKHPMMVLLPIVLPDASGPSDHLCHHSARTHPHPMLSQSGSSYTL